MQRDITDAYLRTVKPPEAGRLEIWDMRAPGLVLRITPAGTATWSVRTRTRDGKRTRPKLGTWPALGVSEARKRARAATAAIEGGADLVEEKRAAKADRLARAQLKTVAAALDDWQADRTPEWSDRYAGEVARIVKRDIEPAIGKRALVETTRADWTAIVAAKKRTAPAMASLLYRVCSAFLNHAEAQGWILAPLLPRKGLVALAAPPDSRKRVLTDDELRAVWTAAEEVSPKSGAFVRLLIATAAREMEVADIAIGEIDLEGARWTIPGDRTKNRLPVTVPLPARVVVDLRELFPAHDQPAPGWRILGQIAGSGFRGFSKLKRAIDEASGVTAWRWHDLRRTARTGMTRLGIPRDHAEAAINHISGRSTLERTYDRHDYLAEVIEALSVWQRHVEGLLRSAGGAEIIPMRRAT